MTTERENNVMNKFVVCTRGEDKIAIINLAPLAAGITKEEANELAAWLITIAEATKEEVEAACHAVIAE